MLEGGKSDVVEKQVDAKVLKVGSRAFVTEMI